MNIPPIQQPGAMGVGQMTQPVNPQIPQNPQQTQQQQVQQQQQQQQQQQTQEKLDNISKVKSLIGPLRESLAIALKTAAHTLHQNSLVDVGSLKGIDQPDHRFNKNMEEFYSICDQIELHLKTSIECLSQNSSSLRYLPVSVIPTRTDTVGAQEGPALTYPQFLMTVRAQVAYVREIHDTLVSAAHSITSGE
ncbi:mediator of RNA polymerase II transcription subunit 29-like [Megachile rotundata]|uniref:mediator of RNA polymerase II transcription subunit 29-like n=1 Tax=Megachile rotundata TaxID=143995 RepID=UPI003FD426E9